MKCIYCKNSECEKTLTTHIAKICDNIILIKNVPCFKCSQCGEEYYSNEVTKNIENLIKSVSLFSEEVLTIDYPTTDVSVSKPTQLHL